MKALFFAFFLMVAHLTFAQSLPVITASPTNTTVYPGSTATFNVTATGATGWQWRFNGTNIADATNATLSVVNAQSTNCGYYSVVVKNTTGWVPSKMVYLFLDYTAGVVPSTAGGVLPLSSTNNTYFAGDVQVTFFAGSGPPTNGTVQIVAGPQLDQMQPVGAFVPFRVSPVSNRFYNGYFNAPDQSTFNNLSDKFIATFAPGQPYYYSVVVKYTNNGIAVTQPSTVLKLTAGTNGIPAQSNYGLKFPGWVPAETPMDPWLSFPDYSSSTNQVRVVGETFSLTNSYTGYTDYGTPKFQWRKNGKLIGAQQLFDNSAPYGPYLAVANMVLTITNAQPSDAGVYDVDVRGNMWFIGAKIYVSIQTTNGQGVLQKPKLIGTNLTCNIVGAVGRNYKVQWSTNLTSWNDLTTLSNATGTVTFTNAPGIDRTRFYRTVLLP